MTKLGMEDTLLEDEEIIENNSSKAEDEPLLEETLSEERDGGADESREEKQPFTFIDGVGAERYQAALDGLNKLFERLNKDLFDSEIGKPVISIQTGKRGPKVKCWCSEEQVWRKTEENQPTYYEICYNAEFISRPVLELAEDMLHQMIHIHNAQRGIKDTSRGGAYHNKAFMAAAEAHGLKCDALDKKAGYCNIAIPHNIAEIISETVSDELFHITRDTIEPPKKEKKSSPPTAVDEFKTRLKEAMKDRYPHAEQAKPWDVAELVAEISRSMLEEEQAIADLYPEKDRPQIPTIDFDFSKPSQYTGGDGPQEEQPVRRTKKDMRKLLRTQFELTSFQCPCCDATVFTDDPNTELLCAKCSVPMEKTQEA